MKMAREAIMWRLLLTAILVLFATVARVGEIDRLYVIDCGWANAEDQSLWSPGINAGVPIDFSDKCYLIHHASEGYLLWDTGITDRLAALPQGQTVPPLRQTWHRSGTLVAALAALGVSPTNVRYVAISHIHPDHVGNLDAFPAAVVIMQKKEWGAAMALPQKPFSAHKTELLEGDKDLFGDGSLTALSTPGHRRFCGRDYRHPGCNGTGAACVGLGPPHTARPPRRRPPGAAPRAATDAGDPKPARHVG
jgi:N-acyl homoserine lactone hydrolase